jgi:hypothetical protein
MKKLVKMFVPKTRIDTQTKGNYISSCTMIKFFTHESLPVNKPKDAA